MVFIRYSPFIKNGGDEMAIYDNFTYNGIPVDSFGNLVMCTFDNETERQTQIKEIIQGETSPYRDIPNYYSDKYSSPLSSSVSIIHCDGKPFSPQEARKIRSWLLSPMSYRELQIQSDEYNSIIFYAKFTESKEMRYTGNIDSLVFNLQCNASYGLTPNINYDFSSTDKTNIVIDNTSDDYERCVYPTIKLTPSSTGIISIYNELYPDEVMELNVLAGNTITIDCQNCIISDLIGDFNFDDDFLQMGWLKLNYGKNNIIITGDCFGTISCQYIRMVGV